jgi:hypothetical protein
MSKRTEGYAMLDNLIAEMKEEGLLAMVCTRIAEGDDPRLIATGNGMPWLVLRKWMEDAPERMKEWELAKRCFADGLVWEGLEAARDAKPEDVAVKRLQVDTYHKTAGRMSRVEWGGEQSVASGFGAGGITIIIGEVVSPYAALPDKVVEHVPETVQAQPMQVSTVEEV